MNIFLERMMLSIPGFRIIIILLAFFIFGWLLFTYRILDVPPSINGDEAAIGYNAVLVARTGHDSNGRFLPLFTAAEDSKDWKQPITFYSEVLAFRLFGPSYFVLRAVSVFLVLLSGSIIFLLVYELFGLKAAICSLLIFATTPIIMIQSHLALENIAPVPFIAFWLWMIVKYNKNAKNKYLVLAATSLGCSIYSYLGLRLIVLPLIILTIAFVYFLNRKSPKMVIHQVLIFLILISVFPLMLLVVKNQYPGSALGLYRAYKVTSYQQILLPFISAFDPSFLFLQGDTTPYHSTGKQGMFLLASLPLFALGLAKILQKRQPILVVIAISFFLMPILFGLASDIHRASRLLSLIPSYAVISSVGMITLVSVRNKFWRSIFVFAMILVILLNFADFIKDYWYEYPTRVKSDFSKPGEIESL
ncbi:MAG: glycosyltransferase family 39 protein [Patescibacteria group bacterium]|nr:glycosyltransferase family 39 protein [Patescibacteria group bacterium]